MHGETVKRNC